MIDISWLSEQSRQLHGIFYDLFYVLVTVFLLVGVLVEYFRLPLGGLPSFATLVGRAIVATLLLVSYPDIANTFADLADQLAEKVGNLNDFRLVLAKMSEKLDTLSANWVSVKETAILAISFLTFFCLYFSTYIAEGIHLFTWSLCYVFSPILIALFVLPATSTSTKALFRTLFEVSCWKIVWSVLATLLWSSALTDLNQPEADVNFISVICLNLTLAGSVLLTPWVVHALANTGLAGFTRTVGSIAVGAATVSPAKVASTVKQMTTVGIDRYRQSVKRNEAQGSSSRTSQSRNTK